MNESFQKQAQLEKIVDDAVGPVWASWRRKRMMREELLAHVSAVFEEEYSRQYDERTALAATRERFGVAADLERQLQAAVPLLGGWFLLTEKELLMARWLWFAAIAAVAVGMGFVTPAVAKIQQVAVADGTELVIFLTLGELITFGGLIVFGYGIFRRFTRTS